MPTRDTTTISIAADSASRASSGGSLGAASNAMTDWAGTDGRSNAPLPGSPVTDVWPFATND